MKKLEVQARLPDGQPHAWRFQAMQLVFDRPVEMRLLAEGADEATLQYFLREIQELLILDHPAYLPVMDYGVTAGRPFYLVPAREGALLTELAPDPDLDLDTRCRIARTLADAVAAAHCEGIYLGGLSPALLRWDAQREQLGFLHHRAVVGGLPLPAEPPADVVPGVEPTGPADVFHWAHLAYWLVAGGRQPWGKEGSAIPIRIHVPELGRDLAHMLDASLAADPADRPGNLEEVRTFLADTDPDVVPEDERTYEASGVIPIDRIGETLQDLRQKEAIRRVPESRAIPVPQLEEKDLFDGPLPSLPRLEASRGWVMIGGGILALTLFALVLSSLGRRPSRTIKPPPEATGEATIGRELKGKSDPHLRFLLATREVTPVSFQVTWTLARNVSRRGNLPEHLSGDDRFEAIRKEFVEDPPAGCLALEQLLEKVRAEVDAPPPEDDEEEP